MNYWYQENIYQLLLGFWLAIFGSNVVGESIPVRSKNWKRHGEWAKSVKETSSWHMTSIVTDILYAYRVDEFQAYIYI